MSTPARAGWLEEANRWARPAGAALDGRLVPYINLDNAASTPPLQDVLDAVQQFLPYYSSVHRGAGFKSRVSTAAYDWRTARWRASSAPTRAPAR